MKNETLWEAICALAGPEGENPVNVDEAIGRSAVTEGIASVELRQFAETNLLRTLPGGQVQLTVNGRSMAATRHHTADLTQTAPE